MRIAVKRTSALLALGLCAFFIPSVAFALDVDTHARATEAVGSLLPVPALSASEARPEAATDRGIAASKMRQRRKEAGAKHGAKLGAKLGGKRGEKIGGRVGKHLAGSKTSHRVAGALLNHALNSAGF
jgi:hypothetical protein